MESRITRENFHKIWEQILIHVGDEFATPPVVIKINGSVISTLGNFSASTGKGNLFLKGRERSCISILSRAHITVTRS